MPLWHICWGMNFNLNSQNNLHPRSSSGPVPTESNGIRCMLKNDSKGVPCMLKKIMPRGPNQASICDEFPYVRTCCPIRITIWELLTNSDCAYIIINVQMLYKVTASEQFSLTLIQKNWMQSIIFPSLRRRYLVITQ